MRFASLLIALVTLFSPLSAHALQSDEQTAEFSSSRLIIGEKAGDTLHGIVDIRLKNGWKTYWRSPGDAGFPFVIEPRDTASNIDSIAIDWPYPKRFVEEWELEVFGFKQRLHLPVTISLKDAAAATQADAAISYAVCSDICINEQQDLSLAIPADFIADDDREAVQAAQQTIPMANGEHGLEIVDAVIVEETKEAGKLRVSVISEDGVDEQADVFIETETAGLRFPAAHMVVGDDGTEAAFVVPYEISLPAKTLAGETLRLTFVSNKKAVERNLIIADMDAAAAVTEVEFNAGEGIAAAATPPVTKPSGLPLSAILLLALLGGLVLNIMPCVLPVLSIKLLGAVKHGGRNHREVRQSFLASVAGILVFFMGLAVLTIIAKNAGQAVGWGFHFQSPEFLTLLSVVILLFAANMLGWFEIRLPDWLNTHIYDVTDSGALKHRHHLVGDFMMGAFAALMATPCSAPFLGTAIGFALARGEAEILMIFFVLGIGLALPYLVAALVPALATKLPKPGAWMERVKQVMGVFLLAMALWLLWVIANQAHPAIASGVLLLSAMLGAVLHGGGRWRMLRQSWVVAVMAVTLLVGLSLLPSLHLSEHQDGKPKIDTTILWQPFDRAAIAPLVAEGKTVFVDVTADWCLTCKFNKLRVLSSEEVVQALSAPDVVAMQADMTKPMPNIQDYLKSYGRYGIPFNIVYSPAVPEGKPLPELLDMPMVLEALGQTPAVSE